MGNKFGPSLNQATSGPIAKVGRDAEKSSGQGRKAFGLMFSTLNQNSMGALAPLAEVTDKFSEMDSVVGENKKSVATWGLAIGGAMTGAGAALTMMGDKDKIAMNQVKASVEATGKNWDDYEGKMDKAAKGGTKYGYSASQTAGALNRLTIATHDPDQAMSSLNITMQIAQVRHLSLEKAAQMVGKVYGGNTMLMRQFGISTSQLQKPVMDVTKAQQAQSKASLANTAAQQNLAKVQKEVKDGKLKGVAADNAMLMATDKANAAQKKYNQSTKDLTQAQKGSSAQAQVAQHNLGILAGRISGQADAAANSFTGHLHTMTAWIENSASSVGQKLGPALLKVGPVLMGVSAIAKAAGGVHDFFARRAQKAAAAATEEGAATEESSGGVLTLEGALSSLSATLERISAQLGTVPEETTAASVGMDEMAVSADAAAAGLVGIGAGADVAATGEEAAASAGEAADAAMGPMLLIAAAVIALGVGFYEAYKHIGPFHDAMDAVGRAIKTIFVDSFHAAEAVIGWFVGLFEHHWREIVAIIAPFIGLPLEVIHHWSSIVQFFDKLWHDIEHAFEAGWHAVTGFVSDLWHDVTGFFSRGIHAVTGIVSKFWSDEVRGFSRLWHDITHVVTELWHDVASFFSRGINAVVHLVTSFVSREVAGFENLWHEVSHVVTELWNDMGRLFRAGINAVVHLVTSFVNREISGFENLWHSISHVVTQLWNDVSGFFSSGINNVVHIVSGLTGKVIGVFTRLPGEITGALGGLADVILAPFKAAFSGIAGIWNSTVGSLSFHIPSWVPGLGNKGFSMPKIPTFAKGGRMVAPGMALVGEDGPEVLYLPGGSRIEPITKQLYQDLPAVGSLIPGQRQFREHPAESSRALVHHVRTQAARNVAETGAGRFAARSLEDNERIISALHTQTEQLKRVIRAVKDVAPGVGDRLDGVSQRARHGARTDVRGI